MTSPNLKVNKDLRSSISAAFSSLRRMKFVTTAPEENVPVGSFVQYREGSNFSPIYMTEKELNITALGTTQAAAYQLTANYNEVATVTSTNNGVILPSASVLTRGPIHVRNNDSADTLKVYPATDEVINTGAANAAFDVHPGWNGSFYQVSGAKWIGVGGAVPGVAVSAAFTSWASTLTFAVSTGTITSRTGTIARATKVGNLGFLEINLKWQQGTALTTSVTIGALPYTAGSSTNQVQFLRINTNGAAGTATGTIVAGTTNLIVDITAGNWPITASENNIILCNFFYETA